MASSAENPAQTLTDTDMSDMDESRCDRDPKRSRSIDRDEEEPPPAAPPPRKVNGKVKISMCLIVLFFFSLLRPVPTARAVRIGPHKPVEITAHGATRLSLQWQDKMPIPEEDEEEDGSPEGYIVLEQKLLGNNGSKFQFPREEILLGFAKMAVEAEIEALAEDLIGTNGKFGPYEVYTDIKSMEAIRGHFTSNTTTIQHKVSDNYWVQVPFNIKYVLVTENSMKTPLTKFGTSATRETAHLVAFLGSGVQRLKVRTQHIRTALKEHGLIVFRSGHQRVELDGESTSILTDSIHFDVKPRIGVLAEFKFSHTLIVKGVKWNHKAKTTFETEVEYKLWDHPGLPKAKFCYPCKMARPCACEKRKNEVKESAFGPPPAKKQRLDKAGTVAKLAAMLKGSGQECQAFLAGKCRHVRADKTCPFRHQEGTDPFRIHCTCAHNPQGHMCSNGKTCLYLHQNQEDYDFKPEKECALTPHRVRPCRRGCKRRKRGRYPQMRFDSTLGYPGEGPTIVTWNARGLANTKKVAALLRRAKHSKWDALLVQEVMWDEKSEKAAHTIARVCEFDMYASRGSSGHQGGSAVFIRKDSEKIKVRGKIKIKTDLQGYCAVPVLIEGTKARLVSIYVPPEARLQSWFLRELKKKKLLKKDDIVGGDFNCVADPDSDARRDDGTRYDPKHGAMCETIMNEAGLGDSFRLYHGKDARDFTRLDKGVQTRLDRIYTRKYNAHWRITGHEHDHKMLEWSDHSAVAISLNVAPLRDASPIEEKIDPAIFRDPEVREDMRDLWRQAYAERPATSDAAIGYRRGQA